MRPGKSSLIGGGVCQGTREAALAKRFNIVEVEEEDEQLVFEIGEVAGVKEHLLEGDLQDVESMSMQTTTYCRSVIMTCH